jgi:phosphate/sulfate permease
VLTAAVLEFSGALLMGTHVTSTMQKGILVANVFQGKDTLLFAGLLSSLAAAGTWLQVHFAYKHLLPFNSFRYITFCMRFEFIRGIYDIIQSRSYVFRS